MTSKQAKTRKPAEPGGAKRAAGGAPKGADDRRRQGPSVSHASDNTPLRSANSSDADPDARHAPLDSPRPQVTRHI